MNERIRVVEGKTSSDSTTRALGCGVLIAVLLSPLYVVFFFWCVATIHRLVTGI